MVCKYCGSKINDKAVVCPKCGKPLTSTDESETGSELDLPVNVTQQNKSGGKGGYTLTIVRDKQFFGSRAAVKIKIDEGEEIRLGNDLTVHMPITGGEHTITFRYGRRKKVIEKNVIEDVTLYMKWNAATGGIKVQ